ncbi:hypothetical protein OG612_43075 (plasmid) [Streptomyces sp. NBC_01527]|uniref:hypothetical protein n=1 Tax=unclassified Streptomyces TaxID=2593676 RepID=UPI002E132AD1|nr:hypothetical protein OG763_45135 [Streptomyces sp. NBC_01230]
MSNGAGQVPGHRPRTATAHRIPQTLLHALTALLAACLVALGTAGSANAAPSDDLIKVLVVQDPAQTGGPLATLQAIAATTLGDSARADEIFDLNRGLTQKDGGALNSPDDQLHPGWILRLPQDASGPGVQLARDGGSRDSASAPPVSGSQTALPTTGVEQSTVLTIPLAAALAMLGAILLALVTTGIVGRRRLRAGCTAVRRAVHRVGAPARRRRRLMLRQSTSRRFDTDTDSVQRAYDALGDFAATGRRPERPVHALRVDDAGATVWLSASDSADAPWTNIDSTRWHRPAAAGRPAGGHDDGMTSRAVLAMACLVRAGTDSDGRPVFVDLSRLDGILSVTGDKTVARDVVQNLLAEIARTRPDIPVTVLRGTDDALPLAIPPNLQQLPRAATPAMAIPVSAHGTVRAAASRRPVKGVVVVAGTPGTREAAELAALCGPGGAGWTGLVYGEAHDAHWRWYTDDDGHVDIPVLDMQVTVPA